ncbi:hypothetical protein [Emticicia sp. 17c]|uniref:hypothetical protein n=1 Tax=Emticicia sp. 17c TaxID=3127704 RepID=UPI00301D8650
MKKLSYFLMLCVFSLGVLTACENKGDISVSQTDADDVYKFKAYFPKNRTKNVQRYMDDKLITSGDFSFKNSTIDGTLVLDNKMTFYIRMFPGSLKIEFDKSKNSHENYTRMKQMAEGMKDVLIGK